jgi:uncharacterized membrane protein YkvA (DUF1232 family)
MEETGLSPEEMAPRINVSNMTVRRFMKKPPDFELPAIYARAIEDAVSGMIAEGLLPPDSRVAKQIIESKDNSRFQSIFKSLGLPGNFYGSKKRGDTARLMMGLTRIGNDEAKSSYVKKSINNIKKYERLGEEWPERIRVLLKVIFSRAISDVDKLIAFGALFYLIYAFDLIPDYIPVAGLLDDYAILGLAAAYYINKFSYLKK